MHEFWYDYVKLKCGEKQNCLIWIQTVLLYTQKQMIFIKTLQKMLKLDLIFDTSSCELDRPFPKGENKKIIGLMKSELGEKIMLKFVGLRAKSYNYLINDGSEDEKAKSTKKCVIK